MTPTRDKPGAIAGAKLWRERRRTTGRATDSSSANSGSFASAISLTRSMEPTMTANRFSRRRFLPRKRCTAPWLRASQSSWYPPTRHGLAVDDCRDNSVVSMAEPRAACRTRDRLRMEPATRRIEIFADAGGTQPKGLHDRVSAIVGKLFGEGRAAMRATDEGITVMRLFGSNYSLMHCWQVAASATIRVDDLPPSLVPIEKSFAASAPVS